MTSLYIDFPEFESETDLREEDPYRGHGQLQFIALWLEKTGRLTVEPYCPTQGVPADVYNRLTLRFRLPYDVDALTLKDDLEKHYRKRLEMIINARDTYWDGHNWVGNWKPELTEAQVDEMEEVLYRLREDLEEGKHLSTIDYDLLDCEEED